MSNYIHYNLVTLFSVETKLSEVEVGEDIPLPILLPEIFFNNYRTSLNHNISLWDIKTTNYPLANSQCFLY